MRRKAKVENFNFPDDINLPPGWLLEKDENGEIVFLVNEMEGNEGIVIVEEFPENTPLKKIEAQAWKFDDPLYILSIKHRGRKDVQY